MAKEWYFQVTGTENELYIIEDEIRRFCAANEMELVYFRKYKTGHVPMQREVKVRGGAMGFFKQFVRDRGFLQDKEIPNAKRDFQI